MIQIDLGSLRDVMVKVLNDTLGKGMNPLKPSTIDRIKLKLFFGIK